MRYLPIVVTWLVLGACSAGGDSTAPPGDGLEPSPSEQAAELRAHDLVNAERRAQALPDLVHDPELRVVARLHSQDMVTRSFFSHTNPDGMSPFDRLAARSIRFRSAGENIAWNRGYADPAATAVNGWMGSSGHRANILSTSFTHAGMGVAESPDGGWYFTQVFLLPSSSGVRIETWWQEEIGTGEQEDTAASSFVITPR